MAAKRVVTWGATDREYRVECIDMETGQPVEEYEAGNSFGSSQDYIRPDSPHAASLATMREWAEQTAREMAEEYDAEYGGEDPDTTQGIRELYEAIDEGRI